MLEVKVLSSPAGSGMIAINPNLIMYIKGSDTIKKTIPAGSKLKFSGNMIKEDLEIEVTDITKGTITLYMMNGDQVTMDAKEFGEIARRSGYGHYSPDF